MVRLKDATLLDAFQRYIFQFQYGAIKRGSSLPVNLMFFYFNSSMVRLKGIATSLWIFLREFQFQYGAIKSSCEWIF